MIQIFNSVTLSKEFMSLLSKKSFSIIFNGILIKFSNYDIKIIKSTRVKLIFITYKASI